MCQLRVSRLRVQRLSGRTRGHAYFIWIVWDSTEFRSLRVLRAGTALALKQARISDVFWQNN